MRADAQGVAPAATVGRRHAPGRRVRARRAVASEEEEDEDEDALDDTDDVLGLEDLVAAIALVQQRIESGAVRAPTEQGGMAARGGSNSGGDGSGGGGAGDRASTVAPLRQVPARVRQQPCKPGGVVPGVCLHHGEVFCMRRQGYACCVLGLCVHDGVCVRVW